MFDFLGRKRVFSTHSSVRASVFGCRMPGRGSLHGERSQPSVASVLLGPFASLLNRTVFVVLPVIGNSLVERVVYVGGGHEGLDRKEHSLDLQGRAPLVLENVQADAAEAIDVGVVDLGAEEDFRWDHGILFREEKFSFEQTSSEGCFIGSRNLNEEVT